MRHITEIPYDRLTLSKTRLALCEYIALWESPWLLYFSGRTPSLIADLVSTIVHHSSQRVPRVLGISGQFVDRHYHKRTTPSPYKESRFLVFRVRMKDFWTFTTEYPQSYTWALFIIYCTSICRWSGWFNYLLKIGKSWSI